MAVSTFQRWSEESHFDSFSDLDSMNYLNESMPTLENLRQHLNCCLSCGVNWQDDHVSLDCDECGGYSLSRPCPLCEGKCGQQWKRDMACSHTLGKAKWNGNCALLSQTQKTSTDLLSCRLYGVRTTS